MVNTNITDEENLAFCESIESEVGEELLQQFHGENSFSRDEVITASETSLDFLAAMAIPEIYQYQYPPVFLAVWQWLTSYAIKQRDFSRLALGLPRGFGKTTLIKIFILWVILFTKKKFILVIGSNDDKAEEIVADVVDMLDELNIKRTFGDWRLGITKDTGRLKKFSFRNRTVILAGLGAKGSVRGLNVKNERPDIMIFEDIQTREQADSATESDALYRWLLGTAIKAKSPHGCLYVFVANMYPTPHSILRKLKSASTWTKFISGAILEDGTSIWEELQPIKQLLEEFKTDDEAGHPEIFFAEVLNDETASVANKLDITKLVATHIDLSFPPDGKYIIIDLATDKPGANDTVIGLVYVYTGVPILRKIINGVFSPLDTIQKTIILAQDEGCQLICAEDVSYQYTFQYWFDFICEKLGILGIEMRGIKAKGIPKNTRIREGFKKLIAGDMGLAPEVRNIVADQFSGWNPLKKDNIDDILDIVGYMDKPLIEHSDAISYSLIDEDYAKSSAIDQFGFGPIVPATFNCPF